MRIALGADHRGTDVCQHLGEMLRQAGHEVLLFTAGDPRSCDYPDVAFPVAQAVAAGQADRGILICGTGIGMCMAANKVPGVRAALVHDEIGAEMSRRHNDANVLCLSADMLGVRIIDRIVRTWFHTDFEGGRHARRVQKVHAIERGEDPRTIVSEAEANGGVNSLGIVPREAARAGEGGDGAAGAVARGSFTSAAGPPRAGTSPRARSGRSAG